ncbi:MAG: glutamate 5-kinase [Polyangiaceae bacterium]|nr:glutamate 5-kinase [Polyangiaceae bacterium]
MHSSRAALSRSKRIVVKLGSRVLDRNPELIANIASEIAALNSDKRSFLIVSSGAVSLGCRQLGYRKRPKEMARLQAAAAAGQSQLMRRYADAFGDHGMTAAQVLLTHADLSHRERLNNARQALSALLDAGAVPIINENDTVSTDEIRFGDNDQLASMVTPLIGADLLLLLTDVDGVLDPAGRRILLMKSGSQIGGAPEEASASGQGGIASKVDAAKKAQLAGAAVVIGPAEKRGIISDILAGKSVGSLFPAGVAALRARKHWIAYTLRPLGTLLLDSGAVGALKTGTRSLLPIGVLGVSGDFHAGDAVRLLSRDGEEIGRGLSKMGALEVSRRAGKSSDELAELFGLDAKQSVLVHKDDLVLLL